MKPAASRWNMARKRKPKGAVWRTSKSAGARGRQVRKEVVSDGQQTPSDSDVPQSEDVDTPSHSDLEADSGEEVRNVFALDCEMVGVASNRNAIARCSVVDYHGRVVLDHYIKPNEVVTDYRTFISGIRPHHIHSSSAVSIETVRRHLRNLLKGAILVGHAIHNDLRCLGLDHPVEYIRDTAKFRPLHLHAGLPQMPSLKKLSKVCLRRVIQVGEHCSVEDAIAAMDLYRLVQSEWEYSIAMKNTRTGVLLEDHYWPSDV
jgi:DNA polymerase III epsilon subunit-like protein